MAPPRPDYNAAAGAAARCPACGAGTPKIVVVGRDWEFGSPGAFAVARCRRCGWMWTEPPLGAAEIAGRYPKHNYYAYKLTSRPLSGRRELAVRLARGYPIASAVPRWAKALGAGAVVLLGRRYYNIPPFRPGGELLDVGAGAGDYLAVVTALGWKAEGVEVNDAAAAVARAAGLTVVAGDAAAVLRSASLQGPYDFIRIHHTLEHLPDAAAALSGAASRAHRGAILLVAVPNAGGWGARLFGRYWYHWALPFHQNHFTPRTLSPAIAGAGWRPVRIYFVSPPAGIVGSVARWLDEELGIRLHLSSPVKWALGKILRPLLWLGDVTGGGDNLIIEAVKD